MLGPVRNLINSNDNEREVFNTEEYNSIFTVLSNPRRRYVIRYLLDISEETTTSDLAEHISAKENEKSERELNSQERKRTYIALYQCHLPKLEDHNVIEFDKGRGDITRGPEFMNYVEYIPDKEK